MRQLKNFLIQTFDFSPVEVRGFFVLMLIISISLALPPITKVILRSKEYSPVADQKLLDSLLATLKNKETSLATINTQTISNDTQYQLFKFDPNQASLSDLTLLGINDFLAKRIVKYRDKGGKFYDKEDLLKIYGFPDSLYTRLESHIVITQIAKPTYNKQKDKDGNFDKKEIISTTTNITETKPQALIDINLADTTQLKAVRGIGSKLANRIVSFRTKLGGFYDNNQLKEVYGLNPEACEALLAYAEVKENTEINKISINSSDAKTLQSHPYISWKEANIMVKYREQHGNYKKPEDLVNIKILDEAFIKKTAPYLSFE